MLALLAYVTPSLIGFAGGMYTEALHRRAGHLRTAAGLVADPTLTKCFGTAEVCFISELPPRDALAALVQELNSSGLSVGPVHCDTAHGVETLASPLLGTPRCAASRDHLGTHLLAEAFDTSVSMVGAPPRPTDYTWVRFSILSQWEEDNLLSKQRTGNASHPADLEPTMLMKSVLAPLGWNPTATCTEQTGAWCAHLKGTAPLPHGLTADAATPQLVKAVEAHGLTVQETFCGDVSDGARQCLVSATVYRSSGGKDPVSFNAFLRTGPGVHRVTFVLDAR